MGKAKLKNITNSKKHSVNLGIIILNTVFHIKIGIMERKRNSGFCPIFTVAFDRLG